MPTSIRFFKQVFDLTRCFCEKILGFVKNMF